jgi:hypothetical protein
LDTNNDGIPDGLSSAPFVTKLVGGPTRSVYADEEYDDAHLVAAETEGEPEAEPQVNMGDFKLASSTNIDTDNDGIRNGDGDPDIDGDGLINGFDSDVNGNGILNIFDPDANGDAIPDTAQTNSELYYKQGLEYGFIQVVQQVKAGTLSTQLVFTAKVRPDIKDATITVRGPNSLLENAQAQAINPDTGAVSTSLWDRALLDDGVNQDGIAKDLIYGRSVILADGKSLKGNQVLFIDTREKLARCRLRCPSRTRSLHWRRGLSAAVTTRARACSRAPERRLWASPIIAGRCTFSMQRAPKCLALNQF